MLLAFLLSVLPPLQSGPAHAGLHPGDSDVYLELGDVSALLTELERSPLVRFLRDERMAGLFQELGQPMDRPLKELVQQGIASLYPTAAPEGWFPGLKTVSASFLAIGPAKDGEAYFVVLDFAAPEQAAALRTALIAHASEHEPTSGPVPGVERLHMGAGAENEMWCVALGPRIVVGGAKSKVEDFVARSEEKLTGLDKDEAFQKRLAALEKASGTPVGWFALARPLQEIAAKMQDAEDAGFEAMSQLPSDLNPLGSALVARMQFVGERFVTELVTSAAPSGRTVDPAWLEPVPASSMFVYASAFDGAAAGKRMRELLAKDEQAAASLAALEQKLGFGPERVLARLGPGMTVYMAAPSGIGLPETRVWLDCADAAAFTQEFEALVGALGETRPGFQAKTKPYKVKKSGSDEKLEVPVTTLTLPPDMVQIPMISLAPSFAPVGKRLVFGLSSMDVKSELKRVHSGEGEPIVAGAAPLSAYGFQVPAEARSIVVMDWGKLVASLIATAKAFAGMAGPEQVPFDLGKLPPPELFAQHFKPTLHYSKSAGGGLYRRNEASFGPETWFGIGILAKRIAAGIPGAGGGLPEPGSLAPPEK